MNLWFGNSFGKQRIIADCNTPEEVTEATDTKEQLFGEPRLLEAVRNCNDLDAPLLIKKVRATIDLFAGGAEQFDDITMLAVRLL